MLQSLLTQNLQFPIDERVLVLNSAADPCVPWLAQQLSAGELLLAEDNIAAWNHAQTAIQRTGQTGLTFRQIPFHEYTVSEAPTTMDAAFMNILYQPNNAWMHYGLQLAFYALKPGGRLYIEGAKDRGIISLGKRTQELFGNLETLQISKGQRLVCAVKGQQDMGSQGVEAQARQAGLLHVSMTGTRGQQGVGGVVAPVLAPFAEGKVDEGTSLLLENIEVRVTDVALDIGCGAGFIGAHIAARASKGQVTLVDTSLASVAAARKLLEERGLGNAQVLASDGIQAVQQQRFDLIATNPPFHVGGIQTTAIAERFIREAATVLRPRGRFYLVANRFLKYEPTLQACFGSVEEVGGNTRFKVLRGMQPF